jgi:hypothetical protein
MDMQQLPVEQANVTAEVDIDELTDMAVVDPTVVQSSRQTTVTSEAAAAGAAVLTDVSGTYATKPILSPFPINREEIRLDVDGLYPQMTVSGTVYQSLKIRVHWIARLKVVAPNTYQGSIWYKDGSTATFPYTAVKIKVTGGSPASRTAVVTYSGGLGVGVTRVYRYVTPAFRKVEMEYDVVSNVPGGQAVTQIKTWAHPNHPAGLPNEVLSIEKVYQRAGFAVAKSGGDSSIPIAAAGPGALWSDLEMHDAMQHYWSRFANKPQWSVWALFAALHETGTNLGGIMFDDIGPNERQGTAVFEQAFISVAPNGDLAPAAWVARMRFWTAVHELGHTFNLAHSWQKSLGTAWIPLANEPEARSFMNYPYNVAGGQAAFFANFMYRFSDQELLFMRHAPERFVQQGNATWFDHHGFEQANTSESSAFQLELRLNRADTRFEFLEPQVFELKLANVSDEPQLIPDKLLATRQQMTIIVKKDGQEAKEHRSFVQYCWRSKNKVLNPGQADYEPLFLAAGREGWSMAEPGNYTVQVCLHMPDGEDVVSNPLRVRVLPPKGRDEEVIAQDFFTDEVGRVLRMNGTRYLSEAIEAMRTVEEKLPKSRAALHVKAALANALARPYKELVIKGAQPETADKEIKLLPSDPEAAAKEMAPLLTEGNKAAETLGHIRYSRGVDRVSAGMAQADQTDAAATTLGALYKILSDRKVLGSVLQDIQKKVKAYQSGDTEA